MLDDKWIVEDIRKKMKEYFEINIAGEVSEQMLWEAHKAVIRGELKTHGSQVKINKRMEGNTRVGG